MGVGVVWYVGGLVGLWVGRSMVRLVFGSVEWSVDPSFIWMVGGSLVGPLIGRLFGLPFGHVVEPFNLSVSQCISW